MKRSRLFTGALIALSLVIMAGCGSKPSTTTDTTKAETQTPAAASAPAAKPVTLRIAHVTAQGSHFDFAANKFKEIVEADPKANIKVQVFPNGQLGQEAEVLENLQMGAIEMTITGHDPLANIAHMFAALSQPYVFKDVDHAFRVVEGPFGDKAKQQLLAADLRLLGWGENGFRVVTNSKRPLEKPADYQGLKIRSPGAAVNLATTTALGGAAVPTPFGETYTALQTKVIDGQENALPQIYDSKYYEVQKYLSITNHIYGFTVMTISEPVFKNLSPEQQQLVVKAGAEAMKQQRAYSRNLSEKELIPKLKEKGMIVNYPDLAPFREATKNVYKDFLKDFGQETWDLIQNTK